jgi:type I restriction enzyme M protein
MIKLCDPKVKKNNEIETILDPTCGTGGFLSMSIKYLNNKYNNTIDWSVNKHNIFGFDIDNNVKNMTLLNLLLETGQNFNETICKQDTLYNDLLLIDENGNSSNIIDNIDIILANEPFGIKNINYNDCCDKIKNLKIKGNGCELLFL